MIEFVNSGTGIVRRNWFHDLTSNLIAVRKAQQIVSNTFSHLTRVADCTTTFRDNIIQQAQSVMSCTSAGRAYNLYDAVTDTGTLGATDATGTASLGADGVPLAGSPAIDAADPALPVPPGGGSRADIGAFERGAQLNGEGEYCLP
jgi:hypothetical protein